jgi:hypothetical protein
MAAQRPLPGYQPVPIGPQSCMSQPNGNGWMTTCQ